MLKVALTGGIGSGKSEVSSLFEIGVPMSLMRTLSQKTYLMKMIALKKKLFQNLVQMLYRLMVLLIKKNLGGLHFKMNIIN